MKFSGTILYVPDVRASLAFYERAFGLATAFVSEDASFGCVKTEGTLLGFATLAMSRKNWSGGVRPTELHGLPPAFEVGIETMDVQAAYDRAVKAGASSLHPPETKPWGQVVAFVRDADGHVVEIATPWSS